MEILESSKNNKMSGVENNIKSTKNKEYIRNGGKEDFLLRMMNSIEKDESFIKNGNGNIEKLKIMKLVRNDKIN